MKNHQHNYYGTEKTEKKTSKHETFNKQNNSEEKKQKATEEEPQASFARKNKLIEGTCYYCGNTGHILPEFPKAASTSEDKWAFKIAVQNLCAESQKIESQSVNKKTQSA